MSVLIHAECRYAECLILYYYNADRISITILNVMLTVFMLILAFHTAMLNVSMLMLTVIMMTFILLTVIMLTVN